MTYRVQVQLEPGSHVPEDRIVNTWHFDAEDLTALGLAVTALKTFYTSIDGSLSNLLDTTGHVIRAYDLGDPEPRAPVLTDLSLALTTDGGEPLPPELAIVMSFQGTRVSGESQARRRGRVYLGPIAQGVNVNGRPATGDIAQIRDAGEALMDASIAAATWAWGVYSRMDSGLVPVASGWVDDDFDIVRSRGLPGAARAIWPTS